MCPPGRVVGLIGIEAQVMGLIGDGQGAGKAPLAQVFAELLELAAGALVGDQQAIGLLTAGPFLQP